MMIRRNVVLKLNSKFEALFQVPCLIFTLRSGVSQRVLEVIEEIKKQLREGERLQVLVKVFDTEAEVEEVFQSGISPKSAVVIYSSPQGGGKKHFGYRSVSRPDCKMPSWAHGAQWGVEIMALPEKRSDGCARQILADLIRQFSNRLAGGYFPWGKGRKNERVPIDVKLPADITETLIRLNSGPDLAGTLAEQGCALELPSGSKISWIRVPAEPVEVELLDLYRVLEAFEAFERVSHVLTSQDQVRQALMSGVGLDNVALQKAYLNPRVDCFSVRRPDLHFTGSGVWASENDEMPGGFADLVHLDVAYGINQERWKQCFDWLTEPGLLLFVVSHAWSKCYIEEFRWLVQYLKGLGYHVDLAITNDLTDLAVQSAVTWKGENVATIWRQFPIFEVEKLGLTNVVLAAQAGLVRLVPEFAHFGNKAWFSIFREQHAQFAAQLQPDVFDLLNGLLPDSHLIRPNDHAFPFTVAGIEVPDLGTLRSLREEDRDKLVLKITGANALAARSYGVLMGHGLKQTDWTEWIDSRQKLGEPFIVQRRLETGVACIPVFNTARKCGEAFACRVLLRPWVIGGELASVSACAVPSNTLRVHGRVDMAIVPIDLSK